MKGFAKMGERRLVEYIIGERWYGSKGRDVVAAHVVDQVELPGVALVLVEIVFPEGTHEVYQLVVGKTLDGLAEPAVARELVHLIRTGKPRPTAGDWFRRSATRNWSASGRWRATWHW